MDQLANDHAIAPTHSTSASHPTLAAIRTRRAFLHGSLTAATAGIIVSASAEPAEARGGGVPTLYRGWNERNFRSIQKHENAHVLFLEGALGAAKRPKPTFRNLEQQTVRQFVEVSRVLENTGVGAYLGAAPVINQRSVLASAGSIATIEARHAGYLNVLLNTPISQNDENFETPLTDDQVAAGAAPFVQSLNGGPPLSYSDTPSNDNDIAILNFALALEYLEADFYNINVPKFL